MAKKVLQEGELTEKEKKMQELLTSLNKQFGKNTIVSADGEEYEAYGDVIPVTSIKLSAATGINGFPKNKIIEIIGWESAGKSTLSYDIIANCQREFGDHCLLIDKEASYDPVYANQLFVDDSKLKIAYPDSLEDSYALTEKALDSKLFGVIVVDSLTAFESAASLADQGGMGKEARINSDKLRRINAKVKDSNCCVIYINQMREKIGVMFGSPETTSGGNALKFYAAMRIMIRRKEIKADNETNIMHFKIIKNKVAKPMKEAEINILWGKGFDTDKEYIDLAMDNEIITCVGKTWFYNGNKLEIGKDKSIQLIKDNPEMFEEIKVKVKNLLLNDKVVLTEKIEENESEN
jgi:recombination protein RecA